MNPRVYLDYNASAPVWPEAADAVDEALRAGANASSIHAPGRAARARIEAARQSVARLVGADPAGVVFTGGGTEANNQAIRCSGAERVLVSAIEHESVLSADEGAGILPVTPEGAVDLEALDRALAERPRPALVAVMLATTRPALSSRWPRSRLWPAVMARASICDAVQAARQDPGECRGAAGGQLRPFPPTRWAGPQGVVR